MRICIVSNYRKNGYGESTRPYHISVNLVEQGHEVLHLCHHSGFEDGIRCIKVETTRWEPSLFLRLKNLMGLSLAMRRFNPDIIYMHQFNNATWALATKAMPRKKFVFDAHTSAYFEAYTLAPTQVDIIERARVVEQEICQKSDYIICASPETKTILTKAYGLNESKLFVVDNATNITPVTDNEIEVKKKGADTPFICLATLPFDGFQSNELALNYLFEIAALVLAKNLPIKFVVLGGGEKPVPPTANVFYAGYVPDLRKEILAADICLMPYPEKAVCGGARNKFCDFVALGKVVVSSPEGMRGMHTLEPDKNCIVAHDKFDYAAKIIELFESADKIKSLEAEVLKVRGQFNWADRAKEVGEIFKKIMST